MTAGRGPGDATCPDLNDGADHSRPPAVSTTHEGSFLITTLIPMIAAMLVVVFAPGLALLAADRYSHRRRSQ